MTLPKITSTEKYATASLLIVVAFVTGRYSVSNPEVKTSTSIQTKINQDETKDTHTETTITTIKTPDGTVKTVKTIDQVADVKTDTTNNVTSTTTKDVIPPKTNTTNVSALLANDFSRGLLVPAYGVSVTHQVFGPITAGAFGLTNGIVGISIGLNF